MWIDENGNIYQGDMRLGDRAATQEEIDAWELARQPSETEIKRAQRKAIADKMAESGAFEVLSYQAILFAVQETRIKYPVPTASLTDEQIITVMADEESPYYNAGFAKMKAYYDELSSL